MRARRPTAVLVAIGLLAGCSRGDDQVVGAGAAPGDGTGTSTTAAVADVVPTAEELLAVLPGAEDLAGGPWLRTAAPTELAPDHVDAVPLTSCGPVDGAGPTPLGHLVGDRSIAVGAAAHLTDGPEATVVDVVVAVVPDAAAHFEAARAELAGCTVDLTPVDWPEQGDGAIAVARPGIATSTLVLARVGEVVIGLTRLSDDGPAVPEAAAPPTDAELADLVGLTADRVTALVRPPPPTTTTATSTPTTTASTTTTSTTTTTAQPWRPPTADDLLAALPHGGDLPGGRWVRNAAAMPTTGGPATQVQLCPVLPGSPVGRAMAGTAPGGVTAEYATGADEVTIQVGVVPLEAAAEAVRDVADQVAPCLGHDDLAPYDLGAPVGDAAVGLVFRDAGFGFADAVATTARAAFVATGHLVVVVVALDVERAGQAPAPSTADLQGIVSTVVGAMATWGR